MVGHLGDPPDRNRARVGGDHALRRHFRFDLSQDLVLDLEVFEDGLNDEVGTVEAGPVDATRQKPFEPSVFVFGDAATVAPLCQLGARMCEALFDALGNRVAQRNLDPRSGQGNTGDTRAHESGSNHAQVVDRLGSGCIAFDAGVLFERGRGKEDPHQIARDVANGQLGEEGRLSFQSSFEAVFQPVLDGIQRCERSGIVSPGFLQHGFSGLSKDDPASERVLVEQGVYQAARALWTPSLGQAASSLHGGDLEVIRSHQFIDQTELDGAVRANALTGQDEVEGCPGADQPGQPLTATCSGKDPDLDLGQTENRLGVVGGDPIGAGENGLEASAQTPSVDGGEYWLTQVRDALDQFLAAADKRVCFFLGLERDKFIDVGSGDEVLGLA